MSIVLIWGAALAVYLLFAGQISWPEVATGIVLASLATAWARIIRGTSERYFRFLPEFLWWAGRGLGQLFPAAFKAGCVLARVAVLGERAGHAQVQGFDYGAPADSNGRICRAVSDPLASDDAFTRSVDRARRAVAVLLASCAPDRFVVDIDRDSGAVLFHLIVPSQREVDPQWLI